MYSYVVDSPEDAKTKVLEGAGRMYGGDFQWVFDNEVDDVSYAVNQTLKSALVNYETALVSVQGDGEAPENGGEDNGGGNSGGVVIEGDEVHNFTLSGLSSTYYSISGNLSDSKGTVSYAGLTLTQCLKMESSTRMSSPRTRTRK